MKILNLSLDKSILDINSKAAKRIVELGDIVNKYTIIVPDKDGKKIKLSEKVFVYGSGGSNKVFQLANAYKAAKKLLKQEKFDVITVQDQYYLALIGWLLAKKLKIGLELQIHGFERYSGLRKIIAKFIIPKANAIRCVSERLKSWLISELRVEKEKITVTPIYIEKIRHEVKNRNFDKKQDDKFIFLTVGRLVPVKNIGLQIKSMAEVAKKYSNIELWVIGDGPEKESLIGERQRLKLKDKIKFFGWQNDVGDFYGNADAFLLTSDSEGWGMAIVEAASFGLPIIMTDVGLAGEVIKNEESGLVIPTNNQARLEEAMIRIINNNNLRQKLTENVTAVIKNLPSKEETLALYKQNWEKSIRLNRQPLSVQKLKIDD